MHEWVHQRCWCAMVGPAGRPTTSCYTATLLTRRSRAQYHQKYRRRRSHKRYSATQFRFRFGPFVLKYVATIGRRYTNFSWRYNRPQMLSILSMDCGRRTDEFGGVGDLTVWIWRVEAGHGIGRTDSGHKVASLSGQVGRGFGRLVWVVVHRILST